MQQLFWPSNSTYFETVLSIDGNNYVMIGLWNIRSSSWSVSLYTNNKTEELILGRRLEVGANLLHNVYSPNAPKGYIVATPNNKDTKEITKDNMGQEVNLIFIRYDELQ